MLLWGSTGALPAALGAVPPLPPSPVDQFREWLQMGPEEREKQLAEWPEPNQSVLRRKIGFYQRLPEHERERRLAMLDLRHYLGQLLREPPETRRGKVQLVPEKYQALVRQRLEEWDSLGAEQQRQLLDNEMFLNYLARYRNRPPTPGDTQDPRLQPQLRARLRAWQAIPASQREELSARLKKFFELPREARQKTLSTFSEQERREIQSSLEALHRMPPAQRQACIQSFSKLASMSPREQARFLQNAARWRAMSAEERENWKFLVNNLPPLPPVAPPLPPLQNPPPAMTNKGG